MSLNYQCNFRPETIPDERNMYNYTHADKFKTQFYNSYDDIKGGYITYHKNERPVSQFLSQPNFINAYEVQAKMYRDPMGSLKPEYNIDLKKNVLKTQLTYLQDTTQFREEIMALQMRKNLRSEYESKWNML